MKITQYDLVENSVCRGCEQGIVKEKEGDDNLAYFPPHAVCCHLDCKFSFEEYFVSYVAYWIQTKLDF